MKKMKVQTNNGNSGHSVKHAEPAIGHAQDYSGPQSTRSVIKWVAIAGLILGAFAFFMRPKKAY